MCHVNCIETDYEPNIKDVACKESSRNYHPGTDLSVLIHETINKNYVHVCCGGKSEKLNPSLELSVLRPPGPGKTISRNVALLPLSMILTLKT